MNNNCEIHKYLSMGNQFLEMRVSGPLEKRSVMFQWIDGESASTQGLLNAIKASVESDERLLGVLERCGFEIHDSNNHDYLDNRIAQVGKDQLLPSIETRQDQARQRFFPDEEVRLTKLSGASGNIIYKAEREGAAPVILRLWKQNVSPITVQKITQLSRLAGKYSFGPGLIDREGTEASTFQFVSGPPLSPSEVHNNPNLLRAVARALLRMHSVPMDELSPILTTRTCSPPIFDKISSIYSDGLEQDLTYPIPLQKIMETGGSFEQLCMSISGKRQALCHIDGHHLNMLRISDTSVALIDFDDAAVDDPFYDLGNFAEHTMLSQDQERDFLEAYLGRKPTDHELSDLAKFRAIAALRLAVWAFAGLPQGAVAPSRDPLSLKEVEAFRYNEIPLDNPDYRQRLANHFLNRYLATTS